MATSSLILSTELIQNGDVFGLFWDTVMWGTAIGILSGFIYTVTRPIWIKGRF